MTDHAHGPWRLHCGAYPVPASLVRNDRGLSEAWAKVRCDCGTIREVTLYCVGAWTPEAVMDQMNTDLTPRALMEAALNNVRHCKVVEAGQVCGKPAHSKSLCARHSSAEVSSWLWARIPAVAETRRQR